MLAIDAYEQRERSAYWRTGMITSAIVNGNRRKGQSAVTPEDFIPRKRKPQSAVQMAEMLKAATIVMGGQVITGGD